MKSCSTLLIMKEIKIKTTMRYHVIPVRMAIDRMLTGCGGKGTLVILMVILISIAIMESSMEVSHKIKKKDLPHDLVIPFLDTYPKGTEIRILKRYLHFHVHCSITYKSQDMEIAEMSIDGWLYKENVIYTCCAILISLLKKEILSFPTIWMNLSSIGKWNKPDTQKHIVWFH